MSNYISWRFQLPPGIIFFPGQVANFKGVFFSCLSRSIDTIFWRSSRELGGHLMTRRMAVAIRSLPIIFAFFAVNSNLLAASSEVIITHASMSTTAIPLWVAQRLDEKRDNIQMIVIGDVTVLSQALETGRIDATVVPGCLSRRLAEKGFAVLGRCDQVRLPSVGMAVVVDKAYLQQSSDTLQDVVKAITEGMVFIANSKNKPAVIDTIIKQFKLSDPEAAEGAYQDDLNLVQLTDYR